jgi:hypothetical protein
MNVIINMTTTTVIAEHALKPKFTPFICLCSQMMFVGSVAGINSGFLFPNISISTLSSSFFFYCPLIAYIFSNALSFFFANEQASL